MGKIALLILNERRWTPIGKSRWVVEETTTRLVVPKTFPFRRLVVDIFYPAEGEGKTMRVVVRNSKGEEVYTGRVYYYNRTKLVREIHYSLTGSAQ